MWLMERTQFSLLVGRLEREAEDQPQLYAAKVGALAALGYASIFIVTLAILIACYYTFGTLIGEGRFRPMLAIGCVLAILTLVAIVRALWVELAEPEGLALTRAQAPKLFAAIDELADAMGGVPVHSVSISNEFNACIVQTPQWGVFGNYRNHLEIGLPLAMALSIDELKAVLAHEMGHLSGAHGKFSAWIYRQRLTWRTLEAKFSEPSNIFEQALAVFYGWYAPYFNAYSFVLARNQEYLADQAAAIATSTPALGSALTKLDLISRFLAEVFWKRLFDQVERAPDPPYLPYSLMPRAFAIAKKEWAREDWLKDSLRNYASDDDTHPSLAERLAALDLQPFVPAHDVNESALALFEPATAALVKHFDEEWRAENGEERRRQHMALNDAKTKLAVLDRHASDELSSEKLWERAVLLLDVSRTSDALDALALLVRRDGKFPKAHLLLGYLLLEENEDRGLQHLLTAIQHDRALSDEAGRMGYGYLMRRGSEGEANRFWMKAQAMAEQAA
jgi:Zn-dependent protease with chaperone function